MIDTTNQTEPPDQPDGIEDDSHDLPDPQRAAMRVNDFLSEYGDGLIEVEWSEGYLAQYGVEAKPLYARDLQALADAVLLAPPDEDMVTADWNGLLTILDTHYPPDVFTGESGDAGPRLIALTRELSGLRAERRALWHLLKRQTRRRRTWERRTRTNADEYQRHVTSELNRAAGLTGQLAQARRDLEEARQGESDEANAYHLRKQRSDRQATEIEGLRAALVHPAQPGNLLDTALWHVLRPELIEMGIARIDQDDDGEVIVDTPEVLDGIARRLINRVKEALDQAGTGDTGEIQPGIVADKDGEEFWFSGTVCVPRRYEGSLTWGGGFQPGSKRARDHEPWSQVAVLTTHALAGAGDTAQLPDDVIETTREVVTGVLIDKFGHGREQMDPDYWEMEADAITAALAREGLLATHPCPSCATPAPAMSHNPGITDTAARHAGHAGPIDLCRLCNPARQEPGQGTDDEMNESSVHGQGNEECTDVRCRRIEGRCVGMHCAKCGGPCGPQGHIGGCPPSQGNGDTVRCELCLKAMTDQDAHHGAEVCQDCAQPALDGWGDGPATEAKGQDGDTTEARR